MVESTVILTAWICAAELATLVVGAWPFPDFGPIARIASAPTAEVKIKKRKRFLTRGHLVALRAKQYSKVAKKSISRMNTFRREYSSRNSSSSLSLERARRNTATPKLECFVFEVALAL